MKNIATHQSMDRDQSSVFLQVTLKLFCKRLKTTAYKKCQNSRNYQPGYGNRFVLKCLQPPSKPTFFYPKTAKMGLPPLCFFLQIPYEGMRNLSETPASARQWSVFLHTAISCYIPRGPGFFSGGGGGGFFA